jgi:hypothetical protein
MAQKANNRSSWFINRLSMDAGHSFQTATAGQTAFILNWLPSILAGDIVE